MAPPNDPDESENPADDDLEPLERNVGGSPGSSSREEESQVEAAEEGDDPNDADLGMEEASNGHPASSDEVEPVEVVGGPPSRPGVDADTFSEDEPEEPEEGAMSFLDHLEELRWTLAKCVGVFVVSCVLIGIFVFRFADLLHWPYDWAVRGYDGVNDQLYIRSFMGSFSVMFQLFFLGGGALSLPFMLFFIARFVAPGLTKAEKRMLLPGSILAVILFLTGATFSFFILLPAGLRASVMFAQLFKFELLIDAPSYYGLLMWATAGVGAAFEFPLVLMILIHLGLLTTALLRKFRRHAIVAFLVLSAIVTPTPDPITFLFLAGPLSLLYELSIIFGARIEKRRAERLEAEQSAFDLEESD